MKLSTKFLLVLSCVSILSVAIIGLIGISFGKKTMEEEMFNKLTAIRELKANRIEAYFEQIRNQLLIFSEDYMVVEAMKSFHEAFTGLEKEKIKTSEEVIDKSLIEYYQSEFLIRANRNSNETHTLEEFYPTDFHTKFLQFHYISQNQYAIGDKDSLTDTKAEFQYSNTHSKYHPIFNNYLKRFGYYDIFLVDLQGHIVYSVSKEVDFATSLIEDVYNDTNFARVYKEALNSDSSNFIKMVDFETYAPSYFGEAAFVASPVFDGNIKTGVLIFQLPIDRINNIMTDNQRWEKVGLGKSGETYIVGKDLLLRNQSRFLIEDKENYLDMLTTIGTPANTVSKIDNLNTSIRLQKVETQGVISALKGDTGINIFPDYRGIEVLSSYRPLTIQDVDWAIMSELDKKEAYSAISSFIKKMVIWLLLFISIIPAVAYYFSKSLVNPLLKLTNISKEMAAGKLDVETGLCRKDEIGILACSFDTMSASLKQMMDKLEEANSRLEEKVRLRTKEVEVAHDKIQSIITNANEAIITIDEKQNIVLFNPAACEIFGYSNDEILGKSLLELLPDAIKVHHQSHIDNFLISSEHSRPMSERSEVMAKRKNGSLFYAEVSISKQKMEGRYQFTAFLKDVSERKISDEKILSQKKILEDTLESLSYPFYVIDAKTYKIEIANSTARKLGKSGLTTCHALSHHSETPCNSETDPCPMVEVKKTKKPFKVEHIHFDPNGEEIYVEVHGYPILDKNGEVIQMIEYSIDITERKKAQEIIRVSENMFRSISSSASDAIISANSQGVIEFWNGGAQDIFGYAQEEAIGQLLTIIIPEKHHDGHNTGIKRVIGGGDKNLIGHTVEIEGKRKNGEEFPIELSISNWEGKDGMNFSAIIRDITERKRLELKIEEANARMEDELNVGRDIQMSMLPLIFPAFPDHSEFNIYALLESAREVGGDFYDFYFLDENKFLFTIADVSGKGVPSALFMAVCKTLIKSRASEDDSPSSIITHVNDELSRENPSSMFVTLFLCIIDLTTGKLTYTNAGHNPPYIKRVKGKIEKLNKIHGPVVGAIENFAFGEDTVKLEINDYIILFTDGVNEAMNIDKKLYSDDRIIASLKDDNSDNIIDHVKTLFNSVMEFQGDAEQADDITILGFEYLEPLLNKVLHTTKITLKNDLNEIDRLNEVFEEFCEGNQIPQATFRKFNIVFDEILNNIISYAYNDKKAHEIDVVISITKDQLVVTIEDDGIAFNPFNLGTPNTTSSIEDRDIGGLGVHLVKKLMDDFSYKRFVKKNMITLYKSFK